MIIPLQEDDMVPIKIAPHGGVLPGWQCSQFLSIVRKGHQEYSITHIPSGYAVYASKDIDLLRAMVERMIPLEWSQSEHQSKETIKALKAIIAEMNPPLNKSKREPVKGARLKLEDTIVKECLTWLNKQEGCYAEKNFGTSYGTAGKPDITGCLHCSEAGVSFGQRFDIEIKRTDIGELTARQAQELRHWMLAGSATAVLTSLDEVKFFIGMISQGEFQKGIYLSPHTKPPSVEGMKWVLIPGKE